MIYFIQSGIDGGPIKIGYTAYDDALASMKNLQIGNPERLTLLGVIPGSAEFEEHLHVRFAAYRIRGEWFISNDELAAYISGNATIPKAVSSRPVNCGSQARSLPTYDDLIKLIEARGERMFWRERPLNMFATPQLHASWNFRYAGREIGGRTVAIDGKNFRFEQIAGIMNNEREFVQRRSERHVA